MKPYSLKARINSNYPAMWGPRTEGSDSGLLLQPSFVALLYMQGDDNSLPTTRICIVYNRIIYIKTWERRYSRRYVVTLAKRFGQEILKEIQIRKLLHL